MESSRSGDEVFENKTDRKKLKTQSVLQIKKGNGSSDDLNIVPFKDLKSGKKSKANNDKMKKYHELLKKENSR